MSTGKEMFRLVVRLCSESADTGLDVFSKRSIVLASCFEPFHSLRKLDGSRFQASLAVLDERNWGGRCRAFLHHVSLRLGCQEFKGFGWLRLHWYEGDCLAELCQGGTVYRRALAVLIFLAVATDC